MPLWARVILIIFGIVSYISLGVYLGIFMINILDRQCTTGNSTDARHRGLAHCTHYQHDPMVCWMIIWPVSIPVFTIWYIAKYTPTLHLR